MKELEPLCTVWMFLKRLKVELPYDPTILLLGIYPKELKTGSQKRHLQFHVRYSISQHPRGRNNQICPFMMNKENVAYTDTEYYSVIKKEGKPVIYYNMDELWGKYAKWNKAVTQR